MAIINPIKDRLFQGCSWLWRGRGSAKRPYPSLKSATHILQRWNLAQLYLAKEDQKIYESHDTLLEFCWHQHFFTRNQQILLYQEIEIWIVFWCIIFIYFNFSWVFIDCYKKKWLKFWWCQQKSLPKSFLK